MASQRSSTSGAKRRPGSTTEAVNPKLESCSGHLLISKRIAHYIAVSVVKHPVGHV